MKKKLILIIITLIVALSLLGATYAFFNYTKEGSNQKLISGEIYLKFKDNTSSLSLSNIYPQTKEEARSRTDNIITFNVSGKSTTANKDVYYEVYLTEGDEKTGMTRFNPKDIVFDLIEIDESGNRTTVVDAKSFSDFNKKRIWVNTVNRNSTINKTYELRMWLSENVLISDTESNASYTTSEFENSYVSIKVGVYGDFVEKEAVTTLIKKIENTLPLTEADVDGTRYVTGDSDIPNYVWYSGKLWRIVSINNDGSIKLVTQGNMTTLFWYAGLTTSVKYNVGPLRKWLNDEFLPTLANAEDLLVDSTWDYTTYTSATANKVTPTATVTDEKVGLLTIYDYYKVRNGKDSNFLANGYYWWTMSPSADSSSGWYVRGVGTVSTGDYSNGVRPSVVLKSGIVISGGTGEKTKPYTIEGDKTTGINSELLNNRISGEYIKFNGVKYRIVGTEEINDKTLTKVTMADYSVNKNSLTTSLAFGVDKTQDIFSPTYGIGLYLENWYQADSSNTTYTKTYITDTYKKMIATSTDDGIVWYVGPTDGIIYDYTLSNTGTAISATIGLGYYGEMFSGQFGDGADYSASSWLLTLNSYISSTSGYKHLVYNEFSRSYPYTLSECDYYGVRPSFYLKSNVKITGGSGMPHDPYEIVL